MHAIQVSKKSLPTAIRRIHQKKIEAWVKSGAKGLKPKLYTTAEEVVSVGLLHIDSPQFVTDAISAGGK